MGRIEFECLMDYAEPYLHAKPLPEKWIFRREIQMVIAASSELENISVFRKGAAPNIPSDDYKLMKLGYFMLEFDAESRTDKARCTGKRRRDDSSSRDRASEGQTNDRDLWHDRVAWSSEAHSHDHQVQELEAGSRSPSSGLEAQNIQETSTMLVARQQTQNSRSRNSIYVLKISNQPYPPPWELIVRCNPR
ncbi:hypothetical protein I7I51_03034 [Histoplasma capsulatum]|uniref:Uncharacterized protein n=1 Tax=Ajellomyces capsulatus TaxID=5037 RepID=A0A8A1MQ83_AJECA|nr:hypothetical protein I7I51_03034 [Histoplasma capsulatum]